MNCAKWLATVLVLLLSTAAWASVCNLGEEGGFPKKKKEENKAKKVEKKKTTVKPKNAEEAPPKSAAQIDFEEEVEAILFHVLEIDEKRTNKVLKVYEQYWSGKLAAEKQVGEARERLRELNRAKSDDERAYKKVVKALLTAEEKLRRLEIDRDKKVGSLLKPREHARLLLDLEDYRQRMEEDKCSRFFESEY